ncbi:MAG: xanthine dehydrogenase family protein molybdopterin-binding subunit [Pseudomonadota bacterium]
MKQSGQQGIGVAEPRREDDRLLRGDGRYAADVRLEGLLHVVFARSTMPRCTILECDVESALEMDGVVSIFTGDDVQDLGTLSVASVIDMAEPSEYPILAHDTVAAVGQAIAAVVATSVAEALDAADSLFIDLEEIDGTGEQTAELRGTWHSGEVDAAFAAADHVVHATVKHPRLAPSPMEPRAITVEYDAASESVAVWLSTQTPHRARTELAGILGIDAARIRVIAPDVGGAFGMKASLYPEEVLTVWAAFKLRRSVRWVATRSEEFLSATHGRGGESAGQLALTKDGRFLAVKASAELPLGHWLPTSAAIPAWNAGRIVPGAYRVAAVESSSVARTSDTAAVGIYRGAGRPEANCLMERLVDEAAAVTGIDPIEIRLRNLLSAEELPHATGSGCVLDSGQYRVAVERLTARVDYEGMQARRQMRRERGELVGIGIAFYVEPSGKGWESARVTFNPDGSVLAATGGSSQGHGRETAIAQIVADALDVPSYRVQVLQGDTKTCPSGIGALASRSTAIGGSAIRRACEEVSKQLPADGPPDTPISEELVYETQGEAWGYGCYIIEVSVDRETGVVSIESAACIDDIGNIVNPMLVEGQIVGGFAQGIGEALLEEVHYDETGQLLTGSFTDYAVPRADDVPPLSVHKLSTPSPNNELGAKGVGEAGTIGAPAAILNAALDALRPLGVHSLPMPLTSQRVWQAIRNADTRKPE